MYPKFISWVIISCTFILKNCYSESTKNHEQSLAVYIQHSMIFIINFHAKTFPNVGECFLTSTAISNYHPFTTLTNFPGDFLIDNEDREKFLFLIRIDFLEQMSVGIEFDLKKLDRMIQKNIHVYLQIFWDNMKTAISRRFGKHSY